MSSKIDSVVYITIIHLINMGQNSQEESKAWNQKQLNIPNEMYSN